MQHQKGFTILEILVVMALMVVIVGCSLVFDANSYRAYAFSAERNSLVTLLQTARTDAMHNMNQQPHGLAINSVDHPGTYIAFEGQNYATSDPASHLIINQTYPVGINDGTPLEIVFSQLSGDANYHGDIIVRDKQRNITTVITINSEGAILW